MKKYQYGGSTYGGYNPRPISSYGLQGLTNIQSGMGQQNVSDFLTKREAAGELGQQKAMLTSEMQEKLEKAQRKAAKKAKRIGQFGGLLGFGLNFVPGLQGWASAGVQAAVKALQAQAQKKAQEKAIGAGKGYKGTFLDTTLDKYKREAKEMAEGYDPLKAAATSMIGSAISGGIGDAVSKGKDKLIEEGLGDATEMETLVDGSTAEVPKDLQPAQFEQGETLVDGTQVDTSGTGKLADQITKPTDTSWFEMGGEERFKHMFTDADAWKGAGGMKNFSRLLQGIAPIAGAEDDEIIQLLQQLTGAGGQIWGSQG